MVRLTNKVDGKGRAMLDKITYMNTQEMVSLVVVLSAENCLERQPNSISWKNN